MRSRNGVLTISAMLAASFAGGACVQWLSGCLVARAEAQDKEAAQEIRARSIVVVDANGKERIRLGPAIAPSGASAKAPPDLAGIIIKDGAGTIRVTCAAGAKTGAGLNLCGPEGKTRIGIGSDAKGAGVNLFAADGEERCSLGATEDGKDAGVSLSGGLGGAKIGIGLGPEGCGIDLIDANNRKRCSVGMTPKAGAGIFLNDEEGKATWRAP